MKGEIEVSTLRRKTKIDLKSSQDRIMPSILRSRSNHSRRTLLSFVSLCLSLNFPAFPSTI